MDNQNIKNNAITPRKVSNISKYKIMALGQLFGQNFNIIYLL